MPQMQEVSQGFHRLLQVMREGWAASQKKAKQPALASRGASPVAMAPVVVQIDLASPPPRPPPDLVRTSSC